MTARLLVPALLLPALVLALASGCSSQEESYCAAVEDHRAELTEIVGKGTPEGVLALLTPFEDLAEKAPSDIKDEWQQVLGTIRAMQAAVDETGIDPATYDPDHPPTDLTAAQVAKIDEAADGLSAPETGSAMNAVEQQVRDVCHTPLGL